MKKIDKKMFGAFLISALLGAAMLAGCKEHSDGNDIDVDANVDKDDENNENLDNEDSENPDGDKENLGGDKENPDDENSENPGGDKENPEDGNSENPGGDKENPNGNEGTPNNGTSSESGPTIVLPNASTLMADYTTIQGLNLEAGSHIAVVVKSSNVEYWKVVKEGMKRAIEELNKAHGYEGSDKIYMTYESPKTENSVDEQVNILDAVVSENPDVICLAAVDMNSCIAQIEAANQNGIPVIILDSGLLQEDLVHSNCSTDNYNAGKEAAKRLCDSVGGVGQVAVLAHLELSETSASRVKGFVDEVTANYPEIEIVNISYDEADNLSLLKDKMEAVLTLYPNLKGYFCTNQVVGEVALNILDKDQYEKRNISVVGFDMGEAQMKAIREGKQFGTICQNPYGMGYVTIVAGVRAAMGLENDSFIDVGFQWIDQTTIDLEENKIYLYE